MVYQTRIGKEIYHWSSLDYGSIVVRLKLNDPFMISQCQAE